MSLLHAPHVLNRLGLTDSECQPELTSVTTTEVDPSKSVSSAPTRLPTLIWELVIDFIAEEDFMQFWLPGVLNTLRSCSQTCRAWTPRSQYHIFRVISVYCSTTGRKSVEDLAALLTGHPALHPSVHVLVVRAETTKDAVLDTMPQQLAVLLPQLQTLRLSKFLLKPAKGDAFDASLRQFSSVTSLVLDGVTFNSVQDLQRVVSAIPGLKSLQLRYVKWAFPGAVDSDVSLDANSPVRLQVLEAQSHAGWMRDIWTVQFFRWLGLSNVTAELTTVVLTHAMILNDSLLAAVETIIEMSVASLESLGISLGPDVDFIRLCKVLSRCKRLIVLTLSLPCHFAALSRLAYLLAAVNIPTCTALSFNLYDFPGTHRFTPTADHWRALDDALQMPQWQRLPAVYIHWRSVKLSHPHQRIVWGDIYRKLPFDEAAVCRRLRVDLPQLYRAGKLWYHHRTNGGFRLVEN